MSAQSRPATNTSKSSSPVSILAGDLDPDCIIIITMSDFALYGQSERELDHQC